VASFLHHEPSKTRTVNSEVEARVFANAVANAPAELKESLILQNEAPSGIILNILAQHK